jgi:hypothetical protein
MKLTEDQNYNELAEQSDAMSDIVQKLNEISKQLGLIHKRWMSSYCEDEEEDDDEDEDEDWDEDDEDEDEDEYDDIGW